MKKLVSLLADAQQKMSAAQTEAERLNILRESVEAAHALGLQGSAAAQLSRVEKKPATLVSRPR